MRIRCRAQSFIQNSGSTKPISPQPLQSCPPFEPGRPWPLSPGSVLLVESSWKDSSRLVGSAEMQEMRNPLKTEQELTWEGAVSLALAIGWGATTFVVLAPVPHLGRAALPFAAFMVVWWAACLLFAISAVRRGTIFGSVCGLVTIALCAVYVWVVLFPVWHATHASRPLPATHQFTCSAPAFLVAAQTF